MAVFKRSGSPKWFIEFTYLGQTVRRSSGTTSKAEAKRLEEKWRREIHDQVALGKAPSISLDEGIQRYFQTVLAPKSKPAALEVYWTVLNQIRSHFGPETPLSALTAATITSFRDQLVQSGRCGPAGANRIIDHIRALLNRAAHDWGLAVTVPRVKALPVPPGRVRFLSADQEKDLLAACAPHVRRLVTFLLDTGCRKSEALGLTWDRVHFEEGAVRVVFTANETKNRTGKGLRVPQRTATLLQELHEARAKDQTHVFLYAGRPLANFRRGFEQACERVGLIDFHIHDLRHCFASKLVQRGAGLNRVQHLLGHKSGRMTERYAHLRTADLDEAVRLLDA